MSDSTHPSPASPASPASGDSELPGSAVASSPPVDVPAAAQLLRDYATHFAPREWNYTRRHTIRHIRHAGDHAGYDHPLRRVLRLVNRFGRPSQLDRVLGIAGMAWRHPITVARSELRAPRHLPDGVLDGAGVITAWEETGEYLQLVQPSVGALVADVMEAHPDSPAVQELAAEIMRISDRYRARIAEAGGNTV